MLRALELNCRTIHAQLQQRQRLRALESYATSVDGILVATDVAARGLDISKIKHVIHYDVSRSPQVLPKWAHFYEAKIFFLLRFLLVFLLQASSDPLKHLLFFLSSFDYLTPFYRFTCIDQGAQLALENKG